MIVLEARSKLLTVHKWVRVSNGTRLMTTFVHCERTLGKAVSMLFIPVHFRTEPYVLAHAATHPG